ncbi:succinylglutamate desuccinylase [Paraburkholderia guartelaensis]|uniref:Succinylglutamate desuccinylase n=1 Tax=Paraburkholderia guartelaensis TaxID=2546446 RepID=A0A4V2ZUJ9_9BURK|nr:succinylglutamate desuccinylase/aspartoacylase family protein [Paraburkholderia guartelaensis]TDG01255.1 succinylglutamate desuccinylase [Paraburkholderia guartelaensis]
MEIEDIPLPGSAPGLSLSLREYAFGPKDADCSLYVQAALHAGEVPGLLLIQHLLERLVTLERLGALNGRIAVMTWANPIGMQQVVGGTLTGRFDCAGSGNFDRRFPDVRLEVLRRIEAGDHPRTLHEVKAWLMAIAAPDTKGADPVDYLKATLLCRAFAHDMALDLHCDKTAIMHVYSNWAQEERATALARCLKSPVLLLEEHAGGGTFDQAFHDTWLALRRGGLPCESRQGFSAVIELRGQRDVSDELAIGDADALLDFLRIEGLVVDREAVAQRSAPVIAALEAVDHVKATQSGIVSWQVGPGEYVERDSVIAEIVGVTPCHAARRVEVRARTNGILVARMHVHFVLAGQRIAMMAGSETVPGRVAGALLPD